MNVVASQGTGLYKEVVDLKQADYSPKTPFDFQRSRDRLQQQQQHGTGGLIKEQSTSWDYFTSAPGYCHSAEGDKAGVGVDVGTLTGNRHDNLHSTSSLAAVNDQSESRTNVNNSYEWIDKKSNDKLQTIEDDNDVTGREQPAIVTESVLRYRQSSIGDDVTTSETMINSHCRQPMTSLGDKQQSARGGGLEQFDALFQRYDLLRTSSSSPASSNQLTVRSSSSSSPPPPARQDEANRQSVASPLPDTDTRDFSTSKFSPKSNLNNSSPNVRGSLNQA